MASFWQKVRADFPITRRAVYLDHASAGPIPRPVAEAYRRYAQTHLERADLSWPEWVAQREEVRHAAAAFIGAQPQEIAFISSTSHGMNLIAEMLAAEGGVLTNTAEFPSTTIPWLWRKAKVILQPDRQGQVGLADLKKRLTPHVRTIVTSWVQYASGFRQDLAALGREKKGRYLVVNATQGLGALPADVNAWQADFLCSNSYKWLLGGYGAGILYVREKWLKRFRPQGAGWRSMKHPERMDNRALDLRDDAGRYEWGCPAFPAIFALGAALKYLKQIGTQKIQQRVLELSGFAHERLEATGFEVVSPQEEKNRAGIVVFRCERAFFMAKKLLAAGIYVSPRGVGLRVAPHFYNTFEEIEMFVKALRGTGFGTKA